jgi:anti-sigma factor RsiW
MNSEHNIIFNCSGFEEQLSDYLERSLLPVEQKAMAEHALSCPLCHALLNDVRDSLAACRTITAPAPRVTALEARVLAMTMPATAMPCDDFEEHLTDYLDGFLPAAIFHRWERHAALCTTCEDLPGMVVRSIGACYTYKSEELAVPEGLHERILESTLGTTAASEITASWVARAKEWVRSLHFPISVPQLAPVAMMLLFAFLVVSQTVSADGTLAGVYTSSVELAEQTYQQSAGALKGKPVDQTPKPDPVTGATYIDNQNDK